jgi:hypothetical protein
MAVVVKVWAEQLQWCALLYQLAWSCAIPAKDQDEQSEGGVKPGSQSWLSD